MENENTPQGTLEATGDDQVADSLLAALTEEEPQENQAVEAEPEGEPTEGSEDQAGSEDEPEPKQEPLYRVKIDGKEEMVTLKEALDGFQRQRDYTQGKQALAAEKKMVQQAQEALRAEAQRYQQGLQLVAVQLQNMAPRQPDESLRVTNPAEYAAQVADLQQHLVKQQAVQAEMQRVNEIQAARHQLALEQALKDAVERLPEVIPEWRDKQVWQKEQTEITKYGLSAGFSMEELEATTDPRAVAMLRKAWKYDQLVSKQKTLKPAAGQVKTAPPGAAKSAGSTEARKTAAAMDRLRKTGSLEDAFEALGSFA